MCRSNVEIDLRPTVGYAQAGQHLLSGRLEPVLCPSGSSQSSDAMSAAAVDGSAGDDKDMALSHRDDDSGWWTRGAADSERVRVQLMPMPTVQGEGGSGEAVCLRTYLVRY